MSQPAKKTAGPKRKPQLNAQPNPKVAAKVESAANAARSHREAYRPQQKGGQGGTRH